MSIDLYQPFRDFDSVRPEAVEANLRRADRKFDVMEQLGTNQVLVCSANYPDAVDDHEQIAEQLHRLADRAAERGMLISYEALAWSTYVNTYEQAWDIVRTADHPALGMCIDSFHILSRGSDPAGIEDIPAEKLFFLQLADAPSMDMDLLQWSRHYRLFPGQGAFDLPAFLGHVLTAGYTGPLSLEVFNDVFRQSDPKRAAVDAHRSLLALHESTLDRLSAATRERVPAAVAPPVPTLGGFAFTELAVDDDSSPAVAGALTALGFVKAGQHRTKPVQLWEQGGARVLLNASIGIDEHPHGAAVAALGLETANPPEAAARAQALLAPLLPRRRGPAEADLSAVAAPDSTSVFFCRTGAEDESSWLSDFPSTAIRPTGHGRQRPAGNGGRPGGIGVTGIDHVALTQPFDRFDEAALVLPGGARTADPAQLGDRRPVRPGAQPRRGQPGRLGTGLPERLRAAARYRMATGCDRSPTCGVRHRRHLRGRASGTGRRAHRSCGSRPTTTTTWTPGSRRRLRSSAPCGSSMSCWTAAPTASSCTSTPMCSAVGSSSRWCSGSATTPVTGRSIRRCGWPRTDANAPPRRPNRRNLHGRTELHQLLIDVVAGTCAGSALP